MFRTFWSLSFTETVVKIFKLPDSSWQKLSLQKNWVYTLRCNVKLSLKIGEKKKQPMIFLFSFSRCIFLWQSDWVSSSRLGIKGKTVLKNWVYSVSEIKAFRSSDLIKKSLAQLFSDSFVVFFTLYLLVVLVFWKVYSLPSLRSLVYTLTVNLISSKSNRKK